MKIGILRETKTPADRRVPLTPKQCRQTEDEFPEIRIYVQPSADRCFSDNDYLNQGIALMEDLSGCDILIGIKEVNPLFLIPGKTYLFFSHTIKKQPQNKDLLKTILDRKIRLIDFEMLCDSNGVRIIGFGRWAGLIGTYNGLRAWCLRQGKDVLIPPQELRGLENMMKQAACVKIPPVRIALTGDGRVAGGSEEMLNAFEIKKIVMEEYLSDNEFDSPVYVQLDPGKYNTEKTGKAFKLNHFFKYPEAYESNFSRFCGKTDLLIMAAYWDPKAPKLFTPEEMRRSDFRIKVIADITCDINGSIPSSIRTTTFDKPYYDYNPFTGKEEPAFSRSGNVTVMTIDNLPCGLPMESSRDFGHSLLKNFLPLLIGNDTEHIIERATIAEAGKLKKRFSYLSEWVYS
jgi:saccharopine dehydrogenase (NAD+, L-lysine-forming)